MVKEENFHEKILIIILATHSLIFFWETLYMSVIPGDSWTTIYIRVSSGHDTRRKYRTLRCYCQRCVGYIVKEEDNVI
jgi:hypothetical protein